LEQGNQDLKNKLLEKEEESSCLMILNQRLLEQIKEPKKKAENRDTKTVEQLENEELACNLKNHNQTLLTQIRKLKNDKKPLENKLEQFIEKKASKSSVFKIQVVEKGANIDTMDITTKKYCNPIGEKTYNDVGVQTMEVTSVLTNRNAAINKLVQEEDETSKVNLEHTTGTIRRSHASKTLYRHPNHKSKHFNQSKYQHRLEGKQLSYRPMNVNANTIENKLIGESYKLNVPQRINLGSSVPFIVHQFCSYCQFLLQFILSRIINHNSINQEPSEDVTT